jgi:hypothetical protein
MQFILRAGGHFFLPFFGAGSDVAAGASFRGRPRGTAENLKDQVRHLPL